jgi:hypothetical protein
MAPHQILFCPFCRESFEGQTRCPEHELELVPLARLPVAAHEHDLDDDDGLHDPAAPHSPARLSALDPRYGRAEVLAAALINGLALVLPLGTGQGDGLGQHRTLVLCAVFPVLWTLLLVSFTLVFVLVRRRTLVSLASLRLLVPALGLASPAALALVGSRVGHGPWSLLGGGPGVSSAGVCVLIAALLMGVGGARLGGIPGSRTESSW